MYRNFGNMGEGNEQCFPGTSNTQRSGSNPRLPEPGTSSSEQQQKIPGSGTGQFIPSLNTITSSQELQWLVQPSLFAPPGPLRAQRPALPPQMGPSSTPLHLTHSQILRPGVIRATAGPGVTTRRRNDEFLSAEELERRRVRRERNKMAAAKCRNRRRELTDSLQNETDQLESDKASLQKEIAELQKEKEKLELVLEAHRPICKIQDSDSDSDLDMRLPSLCAVKSEPHEPNQPGPSTKSQSKSNKPRPKIILPPPVTASSSTSVPAESDSLHTPIIASTPSLTPLSASLIFTYPSAPLDTAAAASAHAPGLSASSSQHAQQSHPCGIAHRRSSSSGDQSSDHSLNSPTILTL